MKRLLCMLAVFVTANVFSQAPDSTLVRVLGVGSSDKEAMEDGFTRAAGIVSGVVTLSDKEVKRDRLIKNETFNYNAGYVDKYTIVNRSKDTGLISLEMDVWIRSSKLADQKLHTAKNAQDLEGGEISRQYSSYLKDRQQVDNLIGKIIDDYPKHAYTLKVGATQVKVDEDRRAYLNIPWEVSWNEKYLIALKEALSLTQDKREFWDLSCFCWKAKRRIRILTKDNPKQSKWNDDVFYFKDAVLVDKVQSRMLGMLCIRVNILNKENNIIYSTWRRTGITWDGHDSDPTLFEILNHSSESVWGNNIQINVKDPKLSKVIDQADRSEVSLDLNCKV
jgi:hypothetical protein